MKKPKILAAPTLPQMNGDGVITGNELEDNHIDVNINRYVNAMVGDAIYLYFGDLEPYYYGIKNVTTDFPIHHEFDAKLIPDGVYNVYYDSTDSFSNKTQSEKATAVVQRKPPAPLLPPTFPDAINNWLTMEQLTNGVKVSIIDLSTISPDSTITLYWKGYHFDNTEIPSTSGDTALTVTDADIAAGHLDFYINYSIAAAISLGYMTCWYTVQINGAADRTSPIASVNIDLLHGSELPAPTYPQATEGKLSIQVVEESNGGELRAAYLNMHKGDVVTFTTRGEDVNGTPVAEADFSVTVTIADQDVTNGYVQVIFPVSITKAIGDKGMLFAEYSVLYNNNGGYAVSAESSVTLTDDVGSNELGLYVSTNAPAYVPSDVNLNPRNTVVIFGQPGAVVTASCTAPAVFMDNNQHSITFILSGSGKYSLQVQSPETGDINIEISDNTNPPHQAAAVMTFAPYSSGNGHFKAYAASTYAINDGVTPCALYVVTDDEPTITKVHVSLSGSATLVSGSSSGTFSLNADHAVEIDLVDTVGETVRATLTLPEASGSTQRISVEFINVTP